MSQPMRHWVCFACRKQFRKPLAPIRREHAQDSAQPEEQQPCPECKGSMIDMGKYFRPPRRRDKRDWEQLRLMAEHGFRFPTAGSVAWMQFVLAWTTGGRLDARPMIANCFCRTRSEGQRLLQKIALRTSGCRQHQRR